MKLKQSIYFFYLYWFEIVYDHRLFNIIRCEKIRASQHCVRPITHKIKVWDLSCFPNLYLSLLTLITLFTLSGKPTYTFAVYSIIIIFIKMLNKHGVYSGSAAWWSAWRHLLSAWLTSQWLLEGRPHWDRYHRATAILDDTGTHLSLLSPI